MVTRFLLYGPITLFLTNTYYNNTSMNEFSRTYSYASKHIRPVIMPSNFDIEFNNVCYLFQLACFISQKYKAFRFKSDEKKTSVNVYVFNATGFILKSIAVK